MHPLIIPTGNCWQLTGPRALGDRSIIGDPRNGDMQTQMNLKIKYRESFRPFAPTVMMDREGEWFELDRESPYMLLVAPVHPDRRLGGEADKNLFGLALPMILKPFHRV